MRTALAYGLDSCPGEFRNNGSQRRRNTRRIVPHAFTGENAERKHSFRMM